MTKLKIHRFIKLNLLNGTTHLATFELMRYTSASVTRALCQWSI